MSRERELLKRWLIDFGKIHPDVGVIKETKELLAQPEQVQELLGTQVSFKDSSGKLITVDISFVRELVERYSEVSSEGSRHRKGYKDRSWGI